MHVWRADTNSPAPACRSCQTARQPQNANCTLPSDRRQVLSFRDRALEIASELSPANDLKPRHQLQPGSNRCEGDKRNSDYVCQLVSMV